MKKTGNDWKEEPMEFLLNPNIAYLLLVSAVMLVVLSLITPGTGLVEIAALFVLVLAGWDIYNLPVNYWALGLLVLGVIPFILAVRVTRKTIFLAFAIVFIVIGSTFLFRGAKWYIPAVNPILVVVTSILSGVYLWIGINKALQAEKMPARHNVDALIGTIGETKTAIHEEGTVQIGGELWSATSPQPISINTRVRVIRREGFTLYVEKVQS